MRFLTLSEVVGAMVATYEHPLFGRDGETLAIDVARIGPADAQSLLIVSSGCHGVEGFCGSGVQVAAMKHRAWLEEVNARGVAVLLIHAINPYGFSHLRRVTHENVDLNRNFQDFTAPLPENRGYRKLHDMILPDVWPPTLGNKLAQSALVATRGLRFVQEALTRGQYEFPEGLFYGGSAPTWSNLELRKILREHASAAQRIAWIDVHTGLGECGTAERAFAGSKHDQAALSRARAWWGNAATPVTVIDEGGSVSAPLTGLMWAAIDEECPRAETTAIAIEFGTQPAMQVMQALRAEQWLTLHPDAPAALAKSIKQDLLDAFYVDTPQWRQQILAHALEAIREGVAGLTSARTRATHA